VRAPVWQLNAIHVRHADVAHQDVRFFPFDQHQRFACSAGRHHLCVAFGQNAFDEIARIELSLGSSLSM